VGEGRQWHALQSTPDAISSEYWPNSALSLLTALLRFLLAALSWLLARLLLSAAPLLAALSWLLAALSWLLARLLLSAAALLAALAAALLAWLFIRVHNCSFVSSLPTTKPRPLSFLRTLVRKRTIRPVAAHSVIDKSKREEAHRVGYFADGSKFWRSGNQSSSSPRRNGRRELAGRP
jgi:uncharacterized membrane protein